MGKLNSVDPGTGARFMYMYKVNEGPLALRRSRFLALGGLNRNLSCPGSSGIEFDHEYAIRSWRVGYQVGLTDLAFTHGAADKTGGASKSGTRANKKVFAARRNAERANNAQLYKIHKGFHHKTGTKLAMSAGKQLALLRKVWVPGITAEEMK